MAPTVTFGDFGIQALEPGWITARQIEAARIAMTRHVRRGGKVWIRVFPDKPVTDKPAETRMGSGKGNPEFWVAVVHPGRILFELAGVDEPLARSAMERAIQKLPIKARFVVRPGTHGQRRWRSDARRTTSTCSTTTSCPPTWSSRAESCSTCASSSRPGSWTTRRGSATCAARWRGCSPCCGSGRSSGRGRLAPRPAPQHEAAQAKLAAEDAAVAEKAERAVPPPSPRRAPRRRALGRARTVDEHTADERTRRGRGLRPTAQRTETRSGGAGADAEAVQAAPDAERALEAVQTEAAGAAAGRHAPAPSGQSGLGRPTPSAP